MTNDNEEKSALERYLAKRGLKADSMARPQGKDVNPANVSPPGHLEEDGHLERELSAQAESLPHLSEDQFRVTSSFGAPPPTPTEPEIPTSLLHPAGFWVRALAYIIDGTCLWVLYWTLRGATGLIFNWGLFSSVLYLILIYFYYGYFYATKNASPGKLALGLEIQDTQGAAPLSYWRTFFRETIGKMISGAFFCIGFLLVAVRHDKRGIHDLLFDTRVVRR